MLSDTSKQTLYSVVVTFRILSTLVLKNIPILIDPLLRKERKKKKNTKRRFVNFTYTGFEKQFSPYCSAIVDRKKKE